MLFSHQEARTNIDKFLVYTSFSFLLYTSFSFIQVSRFYYIQVSIQVPSFFVYILGFIFMAFLVQKLICTVNIWFNFLLGSFSQFNLLNLFISEVYAKRWPKCSCISIQKLMLPKIWLIFFFLTLTVRGPLTVQRKDFK